MDTRQEAEAATRQVGLNENFLAAGAAHELLITRTESSGSYSGCRVGMRHPATQRGAFQVTAAGWAVAGRVVRMRGLWPAIPCTTQDEAGLMGKFDT